MEGVQELFNASLGLGTSVERFVPPARGLYLAVKRHSVSDGRSPVSIFTSTFRIHTPRGFASSSDIEDRQVLLAARVGVERHKKGAANPPDIPCSIGLSDPPEVGVNGLTGSLGRVMMYFKLGREGWFPGYQETRRGALNNRTNGKGPRRGAKHVN